MVGLLRLELLLCFCLPTLGASPSSTPKALSQETEAHRRLRLLAEGNCVVEGEKLKKAEGEPMRTKGKFNKIQMDMQATAIEAHAASSKLLKEKSAENKVGLLGWLGLLD